MCFVCRWGQGANLKLRLSRCSRCLLWPPYVIGAKIIFLPCDVYILLLLSSSFPSPNLSGRRLDVYHTSTHGVALVRI